MSRKIISLVLSFGLLFQQVSFAQIATELNIAGYLSRIGSSFAIDKFRPLHLRYFSYDNLNDNFKILLDKGDLKDLKAPELESSTKTLLTYFLVGVTLPDAMFWVNLRPDSEDQIIDSYLEKTDVGRIMLEADLQLKKDTAAMTSPVTAEGKEYWDKLYKKAAELYGYDNVTIPTLTRPWIVPGEIIVRESKDSAYVYKATLKVMLEQDYLKDSATYNFKDERSKVLNEYSSQLIRELIIPKLTREVNSSKRYAALRQVYYSLILSRWFKLRFTDKTGTYASLINTKNLTNLISRSSWSKTEYFNQYKKSFQAGEYNIKEPVYTPTGQVIRSYFSGGINVASSTINTQNGIILTNDNASKLGEVVGGKAVVDPRGINLNPVVVSSPVIASLPVRIHSTYGERFGSPDIGESKKMSTAEEVFGKKQLAQLETYLETMRFVTQRIVSFYIYESYVEDSWDPNFQPQDSEISPSNINVWVELENGAKIEIGHLNGDYNQRLNIADVKFTRKEFDPKKYNKLFQELAEGIHKILFIYKNNIKISNEEFSEEIRKGEWRRIYYSDYRAFRLDLEALLRRLQHELESDGYFLAKAESIIFTPDLNVDKIKEILLGVARRSASPVTNIDSTDLVPTAKLQTQLTSSPILQDVIQASKMLVITNLEPASSEQEKALTLFRKYLEGLKTSLQKKGINLERYITIDAVINGIKEDRGKESKATKFVKKLKGELSDIVDDNDVPVEVTEAGFMHIFGLRHRTSNAFVFTPDKKLFLQRRVHNKAEAKTFSIAGGHVVHGTTYSEAATEELLQELRLDEIEEKLEGSLFLIGQEGQFQNDDAKAPNNEFRSLYAYVLTEKEWVHVKKTKDKIDAERLKRTEQEFEKWIEEQQKDKEGYGEAWGYHIVDLSSIKDTENVRVVEVYSDGPQEQVVGFSRDLLLPLIKGTALLKPGTPEIKPIQEIENKLNLDKHSSSPVKTGGIDFRALPMFIQPMGSFSGLNFKLPQLSQAQLSQINIDSEIQQIKNMVQSGIAPSGQRIKELIAACMQKKEIGLQVDSLLICLADIFKLEEENASESSPELREALVIVDSQG